MIGLLQQVLNGATLGATYALLALGLAIVFSIVRLVNFAHGELITICGYVMLWMYYLQTPWVIWAVTGVLAAVLAALAMERVAFRPIRNAAPVSMLLASLGASIMISGAFEVFVSPRVRAVPSPDWMGKTLAVGGLMIRAEHVLTIGITAAALVGLLALLRRTVIGTAMRAAAEDFDAVRLMGIKANHVIAASFALSGLLAGLAAVLTLSRRGAVSPHMGLVLVLNAFIANVVGGMGNLTGAVIGGFLLGFMEVFFRAYLPSSLGGFTTGLMFLVVAVLLVVRPDGLFGQKTAVRV